MSRAARFPIFAITISTAAHAQQAIQWRVQDGGNGHWYRDDPTTVAQAFTARNAAAVAVGGHMATITSQAEHAFVISLAFPGGSIGPNDVWPALGGFRIAGSTQWQWVTGESFTYAPFSPDPPQYDVTQWLMMWGQGTTPLQWWTGNGNPTLTRAIIEWSADCNGDGIVDYGQCRDGSLPDFNGNNVPDCCESGMPCIVGNYPVQWRATEGGNGNWYQLRDRATPVSWTAANAESTSLAGHLATLTSEAENQWVFSTVAAGPVGWSCTSDCYGPWLGGYQDRQDPFFSEPAGGWKWVTGETWGFAPWSCNLPNEADPLQDFLHFYAVSGCSPAPGPRWDDLQDGGVGRVSSFVIEWSADCNNDGIIDKGQILRGQLQDANADGVPDVCQQPTCADADIYRDFNVNGADLGILLSQWGPNTPLTESDFNHDGAVDGADLGVLLGFWGPCP